VHLYFTSNFTQVIFNPAFGSIESLAQCGINIYGMVPIDHDPAARNADIDAQIKMTSLLVVLVRQFDDHSTGSDAIKELFKLFEPVTDMIFQCIGVVCSIVSDL